MIRVLWGGVPTTIDDHLLLLWLPLRTHKTHTNGGPDGQAKGLAVA